MGTLIINPYLNKRFLLDQYPGAAAAYSLRQLSSSATNVVRVRRSSDDAEADFTAAEVSDGTLESWVGGGNNGFVTIWYDQSGNGRNVIETSTSVQPVVVQSGSLILENGNPGNYFNQTRLRSENPIDIGNEMSIFAVCLTEITFRGTVFYARANDYISALEFNQISSGVVNDYFRLGTSIQNEANSISVSINTQYLVSTTFKGETGSVISVNGDTNSTANSDSTATRTNVSQYFSLGEPLLNSGDFAGLGKLEGLIQEVVFYLSDKTAERSAIEANINSYYTIY